MCACTIPAMLSFSCTRHGLGLRLLKLQLASFLGADQQGMEDRQTAGKATSTGQAWTWGGLMAMKPGQQEAGAWLAAQKGTHLG